MVLPPKGGADMNRVSRIGFLVLAAALLMASTPSSSPHMKADYIEACSCHAFCPCYFNKQAEHPYCEFNMAVQGRQGRPGSEDLAGSKEWRTGDLGDQCGTRQQGKRW